jgi:hypothetical protein
MLDLDTNYGLLLLLARPQLSEVGEVVVAVVRKAKRYELPPL